MASAEKPTAAAADITNKSAALEEGAQHDTKAAVSGSGGGVSTSISSTQGDTSSAQLATEDVASKPAVADNGENIIKRGSMASGDQTRAEEEQQHDIPTYAETALPLKTGIQETTKDTVAGSKDVSVEPDIPLPEKSAPAQEAQQAPPIPAKVSKSDTRDETSSAAQPSTHDDLPRPKPPPIGKDTAPQALSGAGDVPASLTGQQTEQVPSGAVSAAIGAAVASATVAADTQKRDDKQKGPAVPSPKQAPKPAGSTEAPPPTTPEKDTASVKPPPKDRPKKSGGGFWNLFKSGGSSADKKKSWQFWK
ncbi:hypothetical protein BX666DRAFT_1954008 [Dichotomocladium elegans]|nr:hypothetical protein BX666DRAFT_1954008 [Dichotomocladium elegans]